MGRQVTIRNLTKRFGSVTALNQLSLVVEPSEFLVLLGPSGCGKTTLLRCIAGLETGNEGDILLGDQTVFSASRGFRIPAGKRELGMVFQSYALWPHMTVFQNIAFGLKLKKVLRKEIQDRVEQVLEDLSMSGLARRYPSELSGGQQQRVAVARLLAMQPSIFLMDEPLSNLDARLRLDMRSELLRLHHECGATTIYVTHDQTEASILATRIVVMKAGEIQQAAPPQDVYLQPANLFVAEFVGMPHINLLPARATICDGLPMLRFDGFEMPVSSAPQNGEVVVGARPEDVQIHLHPAPNTAEFQVYSVQRSGPDLFVHVRREMTTIVVRESGQLDLQVDQTVWIGFDPDSINVYDAGTGSIWEKPKDAVSTPNTPGGDR